MKANLGDPQRLPDLARTAPFSPFHFHRLFREATGMTPARFLAALRMAEARRQLLHSTETVSAISIAVGYASVGTFTTQFTRLVGASPARFRQLARCLADVPVAAVQPRAGSPRTYGDGPVIMGLRALDEDPATPNEFWTVAADAGPRWWAAGRHGPCELRIMELRPGFVLTDALVDDAAGSYLLGTARVDLPRLELSPLDLSGFRAAGPRDVAFREPTATDPPLVSAAPLARLAELAAAARDARARGDSARDAPARDAPARDAPARDAPARRSILQPSGTG